MGKLKSRFLNYKLILFIRFSAMPPYRSTVRQNTILLIPEPTSDSPHEKRIKSIQLQPFFCWAPQMGSPLHYGSMKFSKIENLRINCNNFVKTVCFDKKYHLFGKIFQLSTVFHKIHIGTKL